MLVEENLDTKNTFLNTEAYMLRKEDSWKKNFKMMIACYQCHQGEKWYADSIADKISIGVGEGRLNVKAYNGQQWVKTKLSTVLNDVFGTPCNEFRNS